MVDNIVILACFPVAVRGQRNRPICLVLRRFGDNESRQMLVQLAAGVSPFARSVWLLDLSAGQEQPNRDASPIWWVAVASGLVLYSTLNLAEQVTPAAILTVAYLWSASYVWVRVLSGVRGPLLLEYYLALASGVVVFSSLETYAPWQQVVGTLTASVFAFYTLQWTAIGLMALWPRAVIRSRRLIFRNLVESVRDRAKLLRECHSNFSLCPRFIMNAPVAINDVFCTSAMWTTTVSALAREPKVSFAIIELTHFAEESALAWEVTECDRLGVPIFYLARHDRVVSITEKLTALRGRETHVVAWEPHTSMPGHLSDGCITRISGELVTFMMATSAE